MCIVGIGGCGGKMAEQFLRNQDVSILGRSLGEDLTFGEVKGVWLEAARMDAEGQRFFGPLDDGCYPGYYITHAIIKDGSDLSKLVAERYGYDLKSPGFFRAADYLKAIFEIFDMDDGLQNEAIREYHDKNPILSNIWRRIRPYTILSEMGGEDGEPGADEADKKRNKNSKLCDSILFTISLGGGTGTGFINPVTRYIRGERPRFPVFVLGVLTEKGADQHLTADESQRDLGAVISMYDLLTKKTGEGIDGLILVDNQRMIERLFLKNEKMDYGKIDRAVYGAMKPLVESRLYPGMECDCLAVRGGFIKGLDRPPILVPCYSSQKAARDPEARLVETALDGGRLFECDPREAEGAYVFTRGFLNRDKIADAVSAKLSKESGVVTWSKLGDKRRNEVLILLRNPYGVAGAYKKEGTVEHRIYDIIEMAKVHLENHENDIIPSSMPDPTKRALRSYFYGEQDGLAKKLEEAKVRLEWGEKPFFRDELEIFREEAQPVVEVPLPGRFAFAQPEIDERVRRIVRDELEKIRSEGRS
ncbi:MAG: hypothetical protein D4Q77_01695 [Methanothrix sp.]|nr:MAG: hypothetical protein D4Q77_01695 [Methanothrix sp.]